MKSCMLAWVVLALLGCKAADSRPAFASNVKHPERDSGSDDSPLQPDASDADANASRPDAQQAPLAERDAGLDASALGPDAAAAAPIADDGSESITVRDGGEVCLPSGRACLRFAPGALRRDAVVSLRRVANVYGVADFGLEIEPRSLVFAIPPELRIDISDVPPPVPYVTYSVAGYEPNSPPTFRWNGEERFDGDWLFIDVPQPSFCSLGWEPAGLASGCSVRPAGFTPCGGDPEGRWELEGHCYANRHTIVYEGWDFDNACPALRVEVSDWPMSAELEIDGATWHRTAAEALIPLRVTFDLTCRYSPESCQQLVQMYTFGLNDMTCSEASQACECGYVFPSALLAADQSLAIEADGLRLGDSAPKPYCVEGDLLRVLEDGDEPYVTVYRRAP